MDFCEYENITIILLTMILSQASDADAVVSVLAQFKDAQIEQAVNSLSQDELDILMKYIYKYV